MTDTTVPTDAPAGVADDFAGGASVSERLAAHAVTTPFEAFDPLTVSRAKTRLLDALGNVAAGYRAQGNGALRALVSRWGGTGEASVLVTGERVPAQNAAFVNAAAMRSYDFEPVDAETPAGGRVAAHVTGTTASVALAAAERAGASGRALLTALILGDDVACRLAAATGFDVYGGGDNTGTVNGFGGAVVAGRLLGLSAVQLQAAFGIVLNQVGGSIQNIDDKTLAFKLPMAFAARNSVLAVELAAAGVSAPLDAVGARHGFLARFGGGAGGAVEALTAELGSRFVADAVIKPWSSCRASHPSLDACVRIFNRPGFAPSEISHVTVHVTPRTRDGFVGQPFVVGDCPEVSAAFSIPFTTATALLHGTVRPEHLTPEHLASAALAELLPKISIEGSLPPEERLTAEVTVELRDGTVLHERVDAPRGDYVTAPLPYEDVVEKFYANVAFGGVLSRSAADGIRSAVESLESLPDLRPLINLAVGA